MATRHESSDRPAGSPLYLTLDRQPSSHSTVLTISVQQRYSRHERPVYYLVGARRVGLWRALSRPPVRAHSLFNIRAYSVGAGNVAGRSAGAHFERRIRRRI